MKNRHLSALLVGAVTVPRRRLSALVYMPSADERLNGIYTRHHLCTRANSSLLTVA